MPTAVLVDGAFFIKRFRRIEPQNAFNAERAADLVHRWATAHLLNKTLTRPTGPIRELRQRARKELYRIFFYDCPPLDTKQHNPISKKAVDFSRSREAAFRKELHSRLRSKRKLALRLGHLSKDVRWTIKPAKIAELLKGKIQMTDLMDFSPPISPAPRPPAQQPENPHAPATPAPLAATAQPSIPHSD